MSDWKNQVKASGFEYIALPDPVAVISELVLYVGKASKTGLPKGDNDNAFTTLQEALQKVIIDDDTQVRHTDSIWTAAKDRSLEMSIVYVYKMDERHPYQQFREFLDWFETRSLIERVKSGLFRQGESTPHVPTIDDAQIRAVCSAGDLDVFTGVAGIEWLDEIETL